MHNALNSQTIHTRHHEVTLLNSAETLVSLEADIERARTRVWIESFIVRSDHYGTRLVSRLLRAKARGADVRLLYDPLGSRETDLSVFAPLREAGVLVRAYRDMWILRRAAWKWPRDHGRILCIDDCGYTGGIAFGDEWLPREQGGHGWHELNARVEGPVVDDLARAFLRRWGESQHERRTRDVSRRYSDVAFMADAPADKGGIYAEYRARVTTARERVWIENAYCFPPRGLLRDLSSAARHGIDVRLLVPADSDVPLIARAARGEYGHWLRQGILVFEYLPVIAHSKFAVIDHDWATVGSFNLNPSSLLSTNETNLFFFDERVVQRVAALFLRDLQQSRRVTMEALKSKLLSARAIDKLSCAALRALEGVIWTALGTARRVLT
jgi:cardiolipin synthase